MINGLLVFAAQTFQNCKTQPTSKQTECLTAFPQAAADDNQLRLILFTIFGVLAALAIITIVIAAFNIVTGGGDSEKISRARSTVVYALIGLAIALTAEAIVLTVLGKL